jgi:hypothetical protein
MHKITITTLLIISLLFIFACSEPEPVDEPILSPGEATAMVMKTIEEDLNENYDMEYFERSSCRELRRLEKNELLLNEEYIGNSIWEVTLDYQSDRYTFSWLVYENSLTIENTGVRKSYYEYGLVFKTFPARGKRYC